MSPAQSNAFFTDDELKTLRQAFDLACADLGLGPTDQASRARLGACVFAAARTGIADCVSLRAEAAARFNAPASSGFPQPDAAPRPVRPGR